MTGPATPSRPTVAALLLLGLSLLAHPPAGAGVPDAEAEAEAGGGSGAPQEKGAAEVPAPESLPRFEISVSYVANLVHWIDNLAGSSEGRTVRTYRRYWEARWGAPSQKEIDLLLSWSAIRNRPMEIPQRDPSNESGCLPQIDDPPEWKQIFLLRSYEAASTESFVESLREHLEPGEAESLARIIAAFEPRFAQVWKEATFLRRFEKRFRTYIRESGLRPFLGEVARFLGVDPSAAPPGLLHLMVLPGESGTHASAIGRHLMMEIRPGDGPEEQIQVIAHETTHYLWGMVPPGRLDELAAQVHAASPEGAAIWALLREGIPTAMGQGIAEARLAPAKFSFLNRWYHRDWIDRFAKAAYPALDEALRERRSIDDDVLGRLARGAAGEVAMEARPFNYLADAVHLIGKGMLPAYGHLIQRMPLRHRWVYEVSDPAGAGFLDRYRCLAAFVLLGPDDAADPSGLPTPIRPASAPLKSGIRASRRPGGGVLLHLVAERDEDVLAVAERFLGLERLPEEPVLLGEEGPPQGGGGGRPARIRTPWAGGTHPGNTGLEWKHSGRTGDPPRSAPGRWTVAILDLESVDRLRSMSPRSAYEDLKATVYRAGAISSEDFQAAFEQIVDAGILTWEQIEEFERY